METGSKRRGIKGKLATSFDRAPKPLMKYTSKIIPTPAPTTASLGFHAKDEPVMRSTKPKSSSVMKKEGIDNLSGYDDVAISIETINEVDKRAANFISYVQERFKLERINDDWSYY